MSETHDAFYVHEGEHSTIEITISERPVVPGKRRPVLVPAIAGGMFLFGFFVGCKRYWVISGMADYFMPLSMFG